MLRVLTLATLFPNGERPNFGIFVEAQTRALAARGDVEVQVVAPVGLPPWPLSLHPHYAGLRTLPLREARNGLVVHRPRYRVWPGSGKAETARAIAKALLPVLRALRAEFPFEVIDAEFFWPDGPAAMDLARALGVPFSIKARGADIHFWGTQPRIGAQIVAAGRAANRLLAVSAALKCDMVALGLPEENIRVHYTGIEADRFRPTNRAEGKAALGVEGPLLIAVGALIPRKGQGLAICALREIPNATLLLAGAGPDRAKLEVVAREQSVASRVRFLDSQPHAALPGLLAAADVMILPSKSEGLANVWVESLACGTPVVTCDVGGAREVIDRPEAGRLVPRDSAAIAGAVNDLLSHPPDPQDVRKAAERFSWARNAAELFDHLSGIVNS